MSKHTQQQIADWELYEEVRQKGRFNMFSPNARALTGLSKEDYLYCIENYTSLKEQATKKLCPPSLRKYASDFRQGVSGYR
jgi:hypothetical protein